MKIFFMENGKKKNKLQKKNKIYETVIEPKKEIFFSRIVNNSNDII